MRKEINRRDDLIDITVPTDPELSRVDGRNGMFRIQKLYIWESVDHNRIYLEGMGKRGVAIRGGLLVTKECLLQASTIFLKAYARQTRGHLQFRLPSDTDLAGDCQINGEGFCSTHHRVHLRESVTAMEIPAAAERCARIDDDPPSVLKEWNMRCPQCCSDEGIEIQCSIWARLTAQGTDAFDVQDGSHEWNSESPAQCRRCNFSGTVLDFEINERKERAGDANQT
jgi:hypothetical protein